MVMYMCLNDKPIKGVYIFVLKYMSQIIIMPTMAKGSHVKEFEVVIFFDKNLVPERFYQLN